MHITGRDLLPGQSAAKTSYDFSKGAAVLGLILWGRTCFMGLWFSPSLPLEYVVHECGRVVIFCGLKLSTGCTGSVASSEVQSQPLPGANQQELQSNLQITATCVGIGSAQVGPSSLDLLLIGMDYTDARYGLFKRF